MQQRFNGNMFPALRCTDERLKIDVSETTPRNSSSSFNKSRKAAMLLVKHHNFGRAYLTLFEQLCLIFLKNSGSYNLQLL